MNDNGWMDGVKKAGMREGQKTLTQKKEEKKNGKNG